MKKKVLAIVLTVVLVVAAVPMAIWAESDVEVYNIYTAEELKAARDELNEVYEDYLYNYWEESVDELPEVEVNLKANINLNGAQFETISFLKGEFNGNGYTIGNVVFIDSEDDEEDVGFINFVYEATVKDLKIDKATVYGETDVGILVGTAIDSDFINCTASGSATGKDSIGNFVGYAIDSYFEDCLSFGSVNGDDWVGGFIGETYYSDFENCSAKVTVYGNEAVGGFAGFLESAYFEGCDAKGFVTGESYIGGFAGEACGYSDFVNCSAEGKINAASEVGGFIGYIGEYYYNPEDFVIADMCFENCYAIVDIEAEYNFEHWGAYGENYCDVGGFLGDVEFEQEYMGPTGAGVQTHSYVGFFNCYCVGSIDVLFDLDEAEDEDSSYYIGRFAGWAEEEVEFSSCYYNSSAAITLNGEALEDCLIFESNSEDITVTEEEFKAVDFTDRAAVTALVAELNEYVEETNGDSTYLKTWKYDFIRSAPIFENQVVATVGSILTWIWNTILWTINMILGINLIIKV